MSSRVLVVGGAGQGRQAIDVLEAAGEHEVIGVLDRALPHGQDVAGYPVLGSDDEVARIAGEHGATGVLVAIGDNFRRHAASTAIAAACPSLELVSAVHPAAVVARSAALGPGAIAMAGVVISNHCVVGPGALLGTNASIDHDCMLDDFVSLAPGAVTGGDVRVGACSALGVGANVIHGVTIGAHTVVGAGAVVLEDLADEVVAYGVPARVASARARGEPYL